MQTALILVALAALILGLAVWRIHKQAKLYEVGFGRQLATTLSSKSFQLTLAGFVIFVGLWWVTVSLLKLPWFNRLPGPVEVVSEWLSPEPTFGISIYTKDYYTHIFYSTYRATAAFLLATLLGIPFGLLMGWNKKFYDYSLPLVELIRPIPPLAWVPLAILVLPGSEPAVIFVTFLVAFFVTTLNTLLGVESIDENYFRAAKCLGASNKDILFDVVVPGALPYVFTGLQISMGASWFSLVAGEMIAAQYGLGFLIWDSYSVIAYPVIFIGMATLGIIGWASSALVRVVGRRLMAWREAELSGSARVEV